MTYSISEVAKMMNFTAHTLRFYDKEGLLPFVTRNEAGIRQFKESDLAWLSMIETLKRTGMSLKEIKQFIDWSMQGNDTLKQRYEMFQTRRQEVERQIDSLQQVLKEIDSQCWYYETAMNAGTQDIHKAICGNDYRSGKHTYDRYLLEMKCKDKKIG